MISTGLQMPETHCKEFSGTLHFEENCRAVPLQPIIKTSKNNRCGGHAVKEGSCHSV